MTTGELEGWLPIRVHWRDSRCRVDWCRVDEQRFREPFFEDSVTRLMSRPFNQLFLKETPIEALRDPHNYGPSVPPAGFVFHVSRCGSTLVAQMLAALPRNIVLSEAAPIDAVLRIRCDHPDVAEDEQVEWLRGVVSALGRRRRPEEQHLFLKLDSWSITELPLVRRAFPRVPWVFLYRDPAEVLVSQMRQRGAQMVPGMLPPRAFGLTEAHLAGLGAEEYCARVLAAFCESALTHHAAGGGTLVNYSELPQRLWSVGSPLFGTTWSSSESETMLNVARFDAKTPQLEFRRDLDSRRQSPSDSVLAACEKRALPAYRKLEVLRLEG